MGSFEFKSVCFCCRSFLIVYILIIIIGTVQIKTFRVNSVCARELKLFRLYQRQLANISIDRFPLYRCNRLQRSNRLFCVESNRVLISLTADYDVYCFVFTVFGSRHICTRKTIWRKRARKRPARICAFEQNSVRPNRYRRHRHGRSRCRRKLPTALYLRKRNEGFLYIYMYVFKSS